MKQRFTVRFLDGREPLVFTEPEALQAWANSLPDGDSPTGVSEIEMHRSEEYPGEFDDEEDDE